MDATRPQTPPVLPFPEGKGQPLRRQLKESSGEYRQLAAHFLHTGCVPAREGALDQPRAKKALVVMSIERLILYEQERRLRRLAREAKRRTPSIAWAAASGTLGGRDSSAAARSPRSPLPGVGLASGELLLYHGCHAERLPALLEVGFCAPGPGGEPTEARFVDAASRADDDGAPSAGGRRCLVVAQVLVESSSGATADAAPGGSPAESQGYVARLGAQAVPRYLIWYAHTSACGCPRCTLPVQLPLSTPRARVPKLGVPVTPKLEPRPPTAAAAAGAVVKELAGPGQRPGTSPRQPSSARQGRPQRKLGRDGGSHFGALGAFRLLAQ